MASKALGFWLPTGGHAPAWLHLGDPPLPRGRFVAPLLQALKYPVLAGTVRTESSGRVTSDGATGIAAGTISINGKDLSVEYRATIEAHEGLQRESLAIEGVHQPLEKGRVFLVDLTTYPISVVQHDLKLPRDVPDVSSAINV